MPLPSPMAVGPLSAAARAADGAAMAQLQEERSRLALARERVFVLHHELEHAGVALATYHTEFTELRQRAAQLEALASEQRAEALRSVCKWAQQKAELRRTNARLVARNKALEQAVLEAEAEVAQEADQASSGDGSSGWIVVEGAAGEVLLAPASTPKAAGASVEVVAARWAPVQQQRSTLEAAERGRREHVEAEQAAAHRCRLEGEVGRLEQAHQRTRQLSLALSVAMAGGEIPQPWLQEVMSALSPLLEDLSALHVPSEHASAFSAIQNELVVAQGALPDLFAPAQLA